MSQARFLSSIVACTSDASCSSPPTRSFPVCFIAVTAQLVPGIRRSSVHRAPYFEVCALTAAAFPGPPTGWMLGIL